MNYCQSFCRTIQRLCNSAKDNTVLLLPLNGNVTDYSPNHHAPTIHGTPAYVTGYFAGTQAYNTHNGNYIEYLNIPTLDGTFSFDCYAKVTGGQAIKSGSYAVALSTYSQYGGLFKSTWDSVDATDQLIGYTFTNNMWYHIAVTRDDNNTLRLFINGSLIGSTTGQDRAGSRVAINSGATYGTDRSAYVSNFRLTTDVLHIVNNGVYTYPVPTGLYI